MSLLTIVKNNVWRQKMKKIFLSFVVLIMLVIPIASASEILTSNESEIVNSNNYSNQDFTHSVLIEYGSLTTCGPCVIASGQLNSIYNSGDLDFNFVTLVWDEGNARVRARLQELSISSVPDVYFDGKFNHLLGSQANEQAYRNAITQAGERVVPDIDVDLDVTWMGGGTLKINVVVTNNEPETYNGHIRTYIVEKESRWNDNGGNPYHYAVLDIPLDRSLAVSSKNVKPIGEAYTFQKTWIGLLYGFGDITQDNIRIITTVFDSDTDYAVETAIAEPAAQTYNHIFTNFIYRFPILGRLINLLT